MLILAAAVALLTACGGGGAATSGQQGGSTPAPATVRVTTLNLCQEIPVFWASDKGIFAKNNLNVTLVKATGGAAALAAVQGNAADLAFTNPFSAMLAESHGLKLNWVATAYETPTSQAASPNAFEVKQDSPIKGAKDLEGKTVAVNEVGGINQIIVTQWITEAGGNASTVKFVALPFTGMSSAVASGKVDAAMVPAQLVDPKLGLRNLGDPFVTVGAGQPLVYAGYVATTAFTDANASALQRFQQSLSQADQAIADPANAEEKYRVESAHCGQSVQSLKAQPEPPYVAQVHLPAMQRMAQIMVEQKLVPTPPDVNALVPTWARAAS